jgi:hypothetical protein
LSRLFFDRSIVSELFPVSNVFLPAKMS